MSLDETRQSWNFATRAHNAHKRDQASWLRDNSTLFAEETDLVGEVRGRRVLHILCNSGQDTVSWAKRGADVTGVDLSDDAIAFATQLSIDSGIAARFICSEALAYLEGTDDRFDVVVGSYGCLPWIEALPRFFAGVQRVLNDGGHAVFVEFHPLVWSFDAQFAATKDPYFVSTAFSEPVSDYVGAAGGALSPSGHIEVEVGPNPHLAHAWQHTVGDVVTAVAGSGLKLEQLREYPYANGCKVIDGLVLDSETKRWQTPAPYASLPLMLGLRARR